MVFFEAFIHTLIIIFCLIVYDFVVCRPLRVKNRDNKNTLSNIEGFLDFIMREGRLPAQFSGREIIRAAKLGACKITAKVFLEVLLETGYRKEKKLETKPCENIDKIKDWI